MNWNRKFFNHESQTLNSSIQCDGLFLSLCRYAYSLKTQLNDKEKLGGKLSSEDKKAIEDAVEEQIKWLESNQGADTEELKEHKKQLEEVVTPIMTKLYGQGGAGGAGGAGGPPPPHGHDEDSL